MTTAINGIPTNRIFTASSIYIPPASFKYMPKKYSYILDEAHCFVEMVSLELGIKKPAVIV